MQLDMAANAASEVPDIRIAFCGLLQGGQGCSSWPMSCANAHYACLPLLSSSFLCSLLLLLSFSLYHLLALCLNVFICTSSLPNQFKNHLENSLLHPASFTWFVPVTALACQHRGSRWSRTSEPDNHFMLGQLANGAWHHLRVTGKQGQSKLISGVTWWEVCWHKCCDTKPKS